METSFGIVDCRPSVIIRVEGTDGVHGWGEIWCNFPNYGAEYRARLAAEVILAGHLGSLTHIYKINNDARVSSCV